MNAWTVVAADLLVASLAVARILRRPDRTDRHLRLGGVAVGGSLTALVAVRAENIPFLVIVVLIGLAVLAGVWFRPALVKWRSMPTRRYAVPLGSTPFVLPALAVVFVVLLWPGPEPPTAEERDSARFGVQIDQHLRTVPKRVLDHTPATADIDASRRFAVAVPIEKYARDGQVLTLVVRHSAFCGPVEVLLAPAGTTLDVLVVFAPHERVASRPPTAADECRIDPADMFARHSAIDVRLPAELTMSGVMDVGATGPAIAVSPRAR
jgi:hypothetical protein